MKQAMRQHDVIISIAAETMSRLFVTKKDGLVKQVREIIGQISGSEEMKKLIICPFSGSGYWTDSVPAPIIGRQIRRFGE